MSVFHSRRQATRSRRWAPLIAVGLLTLLSGCIIVPDGGGYYHHEHYHWR